jgi:hypothetical protein
MAKSKRNLQLDMQFSHWSISQVTVKTELSSIKPIAYWQDSWPACKFVVGSLSLANIVFQKLWKPWAPLYLTEKGVTLKKKAVANLLYSFSWAIRSLSWNHVLCSPFNGNFSSHRRHWFLFHEGSLVPSMAFVWLVVRLVPYKRHNQKS